MAIVAVVMGVVVAGLALPFAGVLGIGAALGVFLTRRR